MPSPISKLDMPELAKAKPRKPMGNSPAADGVVRKDPPQSNNPSSNITRQALKLQE